VWQGPKKRFLWLQVLLELGRYSQYRYNIDTDTNWYVSIRSLCRTDTDDGDSCKKTTNIPDPKQLVSHLIFIQFNKKLKNYVELQVGGKNRSLCFRTSICRIHCIDQNIYFVVEIQYSWFWNLKSCTCVSYRIRIVSARSVSNTYRYGWWPSRPSPRFFTLTYLLQ